MTTETTPPTENAKASDQPIVTRDVDLTYGQGVEIKLKPGMAWAIYSDDGPGGPCGQGGRTTCPHTVLMTWPNEEAMRKAREGGIGRNKKHRLMCGVVDEWTSSGVFRVEVYGERYGYPVAEQTEKIQPAKGFNDVENDRPAER